MSVETSTPPTSSQQTAAYQQQSGSGSAKKWIACCGIGCFGLFVLCAGGSIFVYLSAPEQFSNIFDMMRSGESARVAFTESEVVKEKLGTPFEPVSVWPEMERLEEGNESIVNTKIKYKGPSGEGYFVTQIRINTETGDQVTEYFLEHDGKRYEITDPVDEIQLDIDDPMEEVDEELDESGVDESGSEKEDGDSSDLDESDATEPETVGSGS